MITKHDIKNVCLFYHLTYEQVAALTIDQFMILLECVRWYRAEP